MIGQMIHIRLEPSVYLALKSKEKNLSKLGNELFKNYIDLENQEMPEEIILLSDLENLRTQEKIILEKINNIAVKLTKVREDKIDHQKRLDIDGNAKLNALLLNNPLRYK